MEVWASLQESESDSTVIGCDCECGEREGWIGTSGKDVLRRLNGGHT
jgi:hypothetical protein